MNRHLSASVTLIVAMFVPFSAYSGGDLQMKYYERFFNALMNPAIPLEQFLLTDELDRSRRLGIEYEDENRKYMIGYDFSEDARDAYREQRLRYTLSADSLEDGYVRLTAELPDLKQTGYYYFKNMKLVSPVSYVARHWSRRQSRHFEFWICDTALFHPAAVGSLEAFLDSMAGVLQLGEADMQLLGKQKIIYVLCKDEDQIEHLTGHRSRGMYLIPYDCITTTWSCHYHELVHLLVNFKLRKLPLYTHPFFQEGLAVAYGGRGGIAARTLLQSGAFLVNSSAIDCKEFFLAGQFRSNDPSLTYPVCGLYTRFLVEALGVKPFLALYRRYSSSADRVQRMMLHDADLPPEAQWRAFARTFAGNRSVMFGDPGTKRREILKNDSVSISDAGEWIRVSMRKSFGLRPPAAVRGYQSKLFSDALPNISYHGERYGFVADSSDVVVYDFYTNSSVAGYSAGFSVSHGSVPLVNGSFVFFVRKDAFPAPLNNRMEYTSLDTKDARAD